MVSIETLEYSIRLRGVFMLVDLRQKKIRFFGWTPDQATLNRVTETVRGREKEMIDYLIAQMRKGET